MAAEASYEDLVNNFIKDYFKNKPNTTGLYKKQGDMIIAAIKTMNQNKKTNPQLKRRIKTRTFTLNDNEELLLNFNIGK